MHYLLIIVSPLLCVTPTFSVLLSVCVCVCAHVYVHVHIQCPVCMYVWGELIEELPVRIMWKGAPLTPVIRDRAQVSTPIFPVWVK